ncbi:hypothetical protein ACJJTC_001481 [Scirpophaga incertulas]
MPPDMAISMRRTKLKAEEAALIAGELSKPSWESRNEGIHERVSFEDSIWGFDLAGGAFYKTPLRVTYVKEDSRAAKAGIRPGDKLKRINDIDTSTLTIQEAHEIIIKSGIHLKLAVTAPEDEEDAYFCYEDPVEDGYDSEEERRIEEEKARKRQVHARVSSYWSLQWPWVSKRRIIYRESNCFMVPSKFEDKHREQFPVQSFHRVADDIVLDSIQNLKLNPPNDGKTELQKLNENTKLESQMNEIRSALVSEQVSKFNGNLNNELNRKVDHKVSKQMNGHLGNIPEIEDERSEDISELEDSVQEISEVSEPTNDSNVTPRIDEEIISTNGSAEKPEDEEVIQELMNGLDEKTVENNEHIFDSISNGNGNDSELSD